jgi:Mg-chelatase subunit ChlD
VVSPPRTALAVAWSALFLASCQPPAIEGAGKRDGKAGEDEADAGPKGADPDFTVSFADGGARDTGNAETAGQDDKACAGELHEGKLVPVDLLFLLDTSGSMEERAGEKSKWRSVRDAIEAFMRDPQSAGLGVGLKTFPEPLKPCTSDAECGGGKEYCGRKGACAPPAKVADVEPACYNVSPLCIDGQPCTVFGLCALTGLRCAHPGQNCPGGMAGNTCVARPRFCTDMRGFTCPATLYQTPMVPIAELPGARMAMEQALATVVPEGGTTTTPAVKGALAHLRARLMAYPERKPVLVLATDGVPTLCEPNTVETAAAELSAAHATIPTHVIGVFTPAQLVKAQPALEQLATAGGTGAPFVVMAGADLTQKFIDAINQIRGATAGCEFTIPRPASGSIDYDKVNVRVTTAAGNEDLAYVGSADRCDPGKGGWYYDVDPKAGTPTRVLVCEATCRKVKITVGLSVGLRYGCKTIVIQ